MEKHKKPKNSIILMGFMGCGKSTIGNKISYRLQIPMEDTDHVIECREKMTISEIFAKHSELYFRDLETKLLQELTKRKSVYVISLGGGTPLREENRELIKKCGTVFYLRIQPDTVYNRLKGDCTRPLLQCENPLEKIRQMMQDRENIYLETADYIIDVDGLSTEEIIKKILLCIRTGQKETHKEERKRRMKILVINGPNLNFLGIREKNIYGTQDYQYLLDLIGKKAKDTSCEIEVFQSNHEGAIIDRIQDAYFDGTQGIVINPGAYTHYSYAIHDALQSVTTIKKVEVHISDIMSREEFRRVSVTAPACDKQIYGHGLDGYLEGIDFLLESKKEA